MSTSEIHKPSLGSFKRAERRTIPTSHGAQVRSGALADRPIPFVIEPAVEGVDGLEWLAGARQQIESWLTEHRALLFRGFGIDSVDKFDRLVAATSTGEKLEYRDRSTPRHTVGNGVYVSTIYPQDQQINPHNEGTYWMKWALKIYFCSLKVPEQGGETPIVDVRNVLHRIDPEIRESFRRKQVLYLRNYNDGFGLPWQDVFQATDRAEVEEYCKSNGISYEWKDGDRLRTRQVRPAIRRHPRTGEEVWFNHAAFFHITSQEPGMREALLAELGEEDLPYNTYYGDGTPIEPEVAEHLRAAYREEMVLFPWQPGDVMLLDNMSIAHARTPYKGAREVIVAMTEPVSGETVS
jgi:alpha-ketoglutarate-dependent taurine dioxygenase